MRSIDLPLTVDKPLVALGQNLSDQIKAIGVARVRIFVLAYHSHIGFRIVGHGGQDVHPDVVISGKHRIMTLERVIQQGFEIAGDPLVAAVRRRHHDRNPLDQLPMLLVRP